jgi:Tol biopolymer transport system component
MITGKQSIRILSWLSTLLFSVCLLTACTIEQDQADVWLLFEHRESNVIEIYKAHPDGSQQTLVLTLSPENRYWLSSNGRRLASLRAETLIIYDIPSGHVLAELNDVRRTKYDNISFQEDVTWSPEADKLVFMKDSDNAQGLDLVLYEFDNASLTPLTIENAINRSPAWAPNGRLLAFAKFDPCNLYTEPDCQNELEDWEIVVVNLETLRSHTLTNFRERQLPVSSIWQKSLCNLSWSPESSYIAFENDCDVFGPPFFKEVFVTGLTSPDQHQITDLSNYPDAKSAAAYSVKWSASGNLLVGYTVAPFASESLPNSWQQGFRIVDVNRDFAIVSKSTSSLNHSAKWSSNGKWVAWHSVETSTMVPPRISVGELRSDEVSVVGDISNKPLGSCSLYYENNIYWSPNGSYLAYPSQEEDECSDLEGASRIIVLSVPDGNVIEILEPRGGTNRPIGWIVLSPQDE